MTAVVAFVAVLATAVVCRAARTTPRRRARHQLVGSRRPSRGALLRRAATGVTWPWQRRAEARRQTDGLAAVLDDVARGLRAGSSLRQSCAEAVAGRPPGGAGLAEAVRQADLGVPLPVAFEAWSVAAPTPEIRLAAAALALSASTGGPQARAIDGVAATLRERRAVAAEIRAQSAQARLSAAVIGLLPAVFVLWALATDRRTAGFLVGGPVGLACLVAGIGFELAGVAWMRRILRGAAP